jgi:hypothetical protein
MKERPRHTLLGPAVFSVTFVAVLMFFWWLLIYGHGVPAAH